MDVDHKKLIERYSIVDAENDNIKIVAIERHRPIAGISYSKGLPMSAYETYQMRYSVNNLTKAVTELDESVQDYQIDIAGIVSEDLSFESFDLKINPTDDDHYEISEYVSNSSKIINSIEEAYEFAGEVTSQFADVFYVAKLDTIEYLDANDKLKYLSKYKEELKDQLRENVEKAWKTKDDY